MKIAQVVGRYYPCVGGVETHVKEISERLVKKAFEVEVLTTDPSGKLPREEVINDVKIKRFRSWAPDGAYYFSRGLKRHLLNNSDDYDIIHAHSYHSFPALYATRAKASNIFVFTPHYLGKSPNFFRNLLHTPYKFVGKEIFKKADKVICVSEYEKKLVINNFKVEDERISVIPNGVNRDELSKFKWSPDFSVPKITYAGRLERRQKNVDKLIRSFELLLREYGVNAELVIIGCGPYEHEMKRLIKKLGLQNRVTLRRWLPRRQFIEELASSNVFVTPSQHECYCIAVAEAIVLGVPTVVSNSTALSWYVKKGWAFGINPPITPQRIASAIDKVLTTPQRETYDSFDEILSWDDVVAELIEQIYESHVEEKL